ncbi:ImmA/IrrE family metallo-endopeptidase [Campylobacter sp. MIT 21-1685]|uniref:ImmA/IrrE family metallo-endopeptidase n=1 Tax=unclassified Campylobacter TaxID=2593542 RepID=UPI00224B4AB2|nr:MULTISPECIES: ImmA/IrrE family metallo-endopeptidase [unclassified Campylobacter]MCX2683762.1 ImmA/IrrE family metallo-endopeptidase [Campylobacter sp. MIT 21-1684]MCX2752046.1 ImmA/IrrE family metallo-endopeptidase [Campylobacter sp. MIT 21-1682]MCX2808228.1 ImmA/IrrE family metallo-endopeptidase [Campylobacter sp. MIT 21-1685]
MVLDSGNSKVIRSIPYQESDIVKIFGKRKAQEFQDFINQISKTFETTTEKLIKLANHFNIPFAYLFLEKIPESQESLPDFRKNGTEFSQNLKSCIASSKKKQEWFRNHLIRNGHNKFLTNQNLTSDKEIIQAIKQITQFDKVKNHSKGQRLNALKNNIEQYNIIVQQSGISQNNTSKAISFNECRGYAIYDEYAPLIFINSKDTSENGKIFTLLHELAHILLKHSGVSSYDFDLQEEYRCNEIAGEILMPSETFKSKWKRQIPIQVNIERLKNDFEIVSPLALATKALLLRLVGYEQYEDFKNAELGKFANTKASSGGKYYSNIIASNSRNFAKSVIIDTLNGYETYKEATKLLNIKLEKFNNLAKELKVIQ